MNTPCQSPHTPVSIHTVTWQRPHTPCLSHVWIADCIKNGGPYRCLSLTRVFLASKTSLSIADHLQAIFINRSTCQAYIETLKMPLTHKQPKKWWTNRQTNKQTNRQTKHSTPAAHARAQGNYRALWDSPDKAMKCMTMLGDVGNVQARYLQHLMFQDESVQL